MSPAGYSGTPLAKKLGVGAGVTMLAVRAPEGYEGWLAPLPAGSRVVRKVKEAGSPPAAVHLFATRRSELAHDLPGWRRELAPAGFLWVSWPKKASKVETDLTEDAIRALALPLGFVDVKVCAVTEIWSGLKLVIRKELRK